MDKQIKYLLWGLILLLISAYFFSLLSGLPRYFKDDIIAFLEEKLSGEISYGSASLWPLNRINLTDFEFKDKTGNIFKAETINFNYSFNFSQNKIIKINLIELIKADIELEADFLDSLSSTAEQNQENEFISAETTAIEELAILDFLSGLKINIRDSKLKLFSDNNQLQFKELNFGLNAKQQDNYQLDLSSSLLVDKFKLNDDYYLNDFELGAVDLQLKKNKEKADLYFNLKELNLAKINNNFSQDFLAQNPNFAFAKSNGLVSAAGELTIENNNISNYQAKVKLKEVKLPFSYDQSDFKEEFLLELPELVFLIEGPDFKLSSEESTFKLDNKNINLNSQFKFSLTDEQFFIEQADLNLNENGKIDLQAAYNFNTNKYFFKADASDFKLAENLISTLSPLENNQNLNKFVKEIKENKFNFKLNTAGVYQEKLDFSTTADLNIEFKSRQTDAMFKIDSSFWYSNDKLKLNSFKINSTYGYLDLIGNFDFNTEKMKVHYAGKNINPDFIKEFLGEKEKIKDELSKVKTNFDYLEGTAENTFSDPKLEFMLKAKGLAYQNYKLNNLNLQVNYANDQLKINDFNFKAAAGKFNVTGDINSISDFEQAELDLNLNSESLYFGDLSEFSNQKLPLKGALNLELELSGKVTDYGLKINLTAPNSNLNLAGQEFELSNLAAEVVKVDDEFKVKELSVQQKNMKLTAAGKYNLKTGFDLNFKLNGFELEEYVNQYHNLPANFSGNLSLAGELKGKLDNPIIDFSLDSDNIIYQELKIKVKENKSSFNVKDDLIKIEDFNFAINSGQYKLEGEIFDLQEKIKTDLNLELKQVSTQDLSSNFIDFYPLAHDLLFKGNLQFSSEASDYDLSLKLNADSVETAAEFELEAELNEELMLEYEGKNLQLLYDSDQFDFKLDLKALLDFNGTVEGSLESPILRLRHQLKEIRINNTPLETIDGSILLENSSRFSATETISFKKGGDVKLDGSYSVKEDQLSLSSNLNSIPLDFLLSFTEGDFSAAGEINGNLRAEGNLNSPELSGSLNLKGDQLELGLSDPIENFAGDINLVESRVQLDKLSGEFVDGDFKITGFVNLSDLENAWNLNLTGQNLYFEHDSIEGDFDAKLDFTGSLMDPVLAGKMEVYDFVVGIPFKWPQSELDPDAFVPRLNLDIYGKQDVSVKSSFMDIEVEPGNLKLRFDNQNTDNPLTMEGKLTSQKGEFSYYNSRFNLENGEAVFTPVDEEDIPTLNVNATGYAGGHEININLTGPADNMQITLSSSSDLTEEEILNLISSQGALGSAIIGGEDIAVQNILWQELVRIINSFLQRDVISNLESDFETALSLDRAEINAFQYGMEQEFAIYLGKNISDNLYLEYASFFNEEGREGELSFQYKLTDQTILKGSYFGDEEYQINIETEIEF